MVSQRSQGKELFNKQWQWEKEGKGDVVCQQYQCNDDWYKSDGGAYQIYSQHKQCLNNSKCFVHCLSHRIYTQQSYRVECHA